MYSDGTLCMDIIQDQWSPIHNVCTLLTSIQVCRPVGGTTTSVDDCHLLQTQSLLTDPNPASPANPEAAQIYLNDRTAFNRCASMPTEWRQHLAHAARAARRRVRRCAQKSVEHT